jgi:hypothetical protein
VTTSPESGARPMAARVQGGDDGLTAGRTPGCRTLGGNRAASSARWRRKAGARRNGAPRPEGGRVVTDARWRLDPSDGVTRRGYVRGMAQKLLSKPTRARIKRDFWRPDEPRLLVRKAWGRGWTVNFARIFRRGGRR